MTDSISRALAVVAIGLALGFSYFSESCNCVADGKHRPKNRVGWVARWITWRAVKDEFEAQPSQDPGALRYENSQPARKKGPTGEIELDHGHGW